MNVYVQSFFKWLDKNKDVGVFLLRLFIGFRLIYGVQEAAFSWDTMVMVGSFFEKFQFPFPLVCAAVSVYSQFVSGILLLLGWYTRYAAILMIINFTVAWIMVDRFGTVEDMTPALAILFSSILFLFQGAGKISLDKIFSTRMDKAER